MKGSADMRKFKMGIRRLGASLSALLMVFCLTVPALAAGNNWPSSPSTEDFKSHHGSWYVYQEFSISGQRGFELISSPLTEGSTPNTLNSSFLPYSTDSFTYSYPDSGTTVTLLAAIPYILSGASGYWSELPSFPVGSGSPLFESALVRIYPYTVSGALSSIDDIFSDTSIRCYLTSAFSSSDSSFAYSPTDTILDDFPVFVPNSVFIAGSKTSTSSGSVTGFGLEHGATNFWATPSNGKYVDLSSSHTSSHNMLSFAQNATIPSSELGLVFFKQPEGTNMHPYNTEFNVNVLGFKATLWVPAPLLPANVEVGDWISHGTMDKLQDQLINDFDVNSDTLKNSKNNFDSWQNSNTIDTDVADTGLNIINALMQNVGQFAFIVSLLCFGAVVLRVLIRKAVEG